MTSLRIAIVSEEYPVESGWGGIGTYSYNLAQGLATLGHRVHVVARGWGGEASSDDGSIFLHRIEVKEPSWRRGTHQLNLRFPESRDVGAWNVAVARTLREIRSNEGLEVVETPEYHSQGLLARLSGAVPATVVRLHTPSYLCRRFDGVGAGGSRLDTWLTEWTEKRLTKGATRITAPSDELAARVSRDWRINPAAFSVIPNPADTDFFSPDPEVLVDENKILFIGRLERRKGVETLVSAMPRVLADFPNARLCLMGKDHTSANGGGSMLEQLRVSILEMGIDPDRIEFLGHIERSLIPAMIRAAAICAVPSLYENFPYSLLEPMSCGRPVVATRVGGIPEIVSDGENGLLVPPSSPDALADAITKLLSDRELAVRLGNQARSSVLANFSRERIARQTADVYSSLLEYPTESAEPRNVWQTS